MATTANKIEKALSILNHHDWYWMMCDSNSAYGYSRGSMRAFVELVATINDAAIVKALRDLWTANYEYVHSKSDKETFKAKEAELMSIINPTFAMAA